MFGKGSGIVEENIANYISISRMVMSILLLLTKTLTIPFIIIYVYCGISDMVDGYIANKVTGFILFIAPLILVNVNLIIFQIIICSIATFAAIQEGHYIRTKNYNII